MLTREVRLEAGRVKYTSCLPDYPDIGDGRQGNRYSRTMHLISLMSIVIGSYTPNYNSLLTKYLHAIVTCKC